MNKNPGIIVQARRGSTRFPDKVIKPFYNGYSILEILLKGLKDITGTELCVATTMEAEDDMIEKICLERNVNIFRGSTDNVLKRFHDAADKFSFDPIVRVCADNPFLVYSSVNELINKYGINKADYIGYQLSEDRVGIRSHFGLWPELMTLSAIKKVLRINPGKIYFEHVTNYMYSQPNKFKVSLIKVPDHLFYRKDIRLTVDTEDDFKLASDVYKRYFSENGKLYTSKLVNLIDSNDHWKEMMIRGIQENEK